MSECSDQHSLVEKIRNKLRVSVLVWSLAKSDCNWLGGEKTTADLPAKQVVQTHCVKVMTLE